MPKVEKWIWLDRNLYPESQRSRYSVFDNEIENGYTVAEFKREYSFDCEIERITVVFCADTECQLYIDGKIAATGPTPDARDYLLQKDIARNHRYSAQFEYRPEGKTQSLSFLAKVRLGIENMSDSSHGRGGFMLTSHIYFADGSEKIVNTDNSWNARRDMSYVAPSKYVQTEKREFTKACEIQNIWHTEISPLRLREENKIYASAFALEVKPGETKEFNCPLDCLRAGYLGAEVEASGKVKVKLIAYEVYKSLESGEELEFCGNDSYRGFKIHSVKGIRVNIENLSDSVCKIAPVLYDTYYPIDVCAVTKTDDCELNELLSEGARALKYCRQLMHYDSPRHCEPLGCMGDYYIESLMTAFSFGDMTMCELDIRKVAENLCQNDARAFHTTYALIWVLMLYDVYMLTGHIELLDDCCDALILLLDRYRSYIGENGIIETPPDYMFIDWLVVDGFSMHHPPKALGQTCLNMFYYGALDASFKIFTVLGKNALADIVLKESEKLKDNINALLYDKEKRMYFEGLNTPTPEELIGDFMPRNSSKRYYLKHSNILAAYFGICSDISGKELVKRIMEDEIEGLVQPYFLHFLFEAIYRNGLRDVYTKTLADMWKKPFRDNGSLPEGFYAPEDGYVFDMSHAWGGSPIYSVPKALSGIEIIKAGYEEISLSPSLIGLGKAYVEIPTPYGIIKLDMEGGQQASLCAPKKIKVNIL